MKVMTLSRPLKLWGLAIGFVSWSIQVQEIP